jgi:hypothetical protein
LDESGAGLVRFILAGLLTFAATTMAAQDVRRVDSIAVGRFVAVRPKHIPLMKRRVLSASDPSLASTLRALAGYGFDHMASDSTDVFALCQVSPADSTGMWITVFADVGSRRVIIPDECHADTDETAARIDGLRALGWETLRNRR